MQRITLGYNEVVPPPKQFLHWKKAVFWLSAGFAVLLTLTWCDGLFDLSHVVIGTPLQVEQRSETTVKGVVILMLWMLAAYKVYKIVSRLSYLEEFLPVCAWCRKIEIEDGWLSIEELFLSRTGRKPSHGMCPQCAKSVVGELVGAQGQEDCQTTEFKDSHFAEQPKDKAECRN